MRFRRILSVIVGVALILVGGQASATIKLTEAMTYLYTSVGILPPTTRQMTVCYGFVCRRRMELGFSAKDRTTLKAILARGKASPAAERMAIQQAFIWFDHRVGRSIGTSQRVARADIRTFDAAHNFDCWDTTRNSTSFLLVLQEWGALRHHTVGDPRYRGNILVGQLPHNTAVIVEKKRGTEWSVDMWTTAYGKVPDVMLLAQWLREN